MGLADYHVPEFDPVAADAATVTTDHCRITVLTPRLLRLEYDPDGDFEDRPSQTVWDRDLPVPDFGVTRVDGRLEIDTEHLHLRYDVGEEFTPESLSITLTGFDETYRYGDEPDNLGGTTRTLDGVDGQTDLQDGLLARDGWTVLEDTDSLVFDEEWVTPREAHDDYEDLYFFGFGHDYLGALRAYTEIAGDVPMIPRWALGNWWSRYWHYSQEELREVVTGFREEGLPLSVCVVDMDWHVVDNPNHDGWTGWSWNRELFPDPEGFVDWLHDAGLKTTLNLHPAEGVHSHETQYRAMAEHMGIDPNTGKPVEFDASDTEFLRGYFEHVIDPLEDEDGIDFWWIDWQQWRESDEMAGLDPLWALNHLHALDRTRDGRRPFVLSRWADVGNHRYQIGFSGDTVISWDSLSFQPYLTSAASNVQFGWWSHDIGGHFGGTGDPDSFGELYARWTQFGALSPINRIHTSKMPYVDKRPWKYGGEVADTLEDALVRRHELIPYLYTMAWRNHDRAEPLIQPLYYHHPEQDAAYNRPNEYYFGSELLAAPHVAPRGEDTNLSRRPVWLPDGEWYDLDSGERYDSGFHTRYGDLDDVPIYAKAGAIVPLDGDPGFGDVGNPDTLRILTFPGADNTFDLYEDDGTSQDYLDDEYAITELSSHWEDDRLAFEIGPARGATEHVPDERTHELCVRGVTDDAEISVDGAASHSRSYDPETRTLTVTVEDVDPAEAVTIYCDGDEPLRAETDWRFDQIEELLWHFEMPAGAKPRLESHAAEFCRDDRIDLDWLGNFAAVLTQSQLRAVAETLVDVGVERIDYAGTDRLVLWNEDRRTDVTYQFAAFDQWRLPIDREGESDRGTVPSYEIVDLSEYETFDWDLTLDYDGVVRVSDSGEGHDPTQE